MTGLFSEPAKAGVEKSFFAQLLPGRSTGFDRLLNETRFALWQISMFPTRGHLSTGNK